MPTTPTYKRDQVEKACAICLYLWDGPKKAPVPHLAADLKRLLVLDRKLGEAVHPRVPHRYAFHEGPPPGKGKDVTYGSYDAFALLVGVQLLRSLVPQAGCVQLLRELREDLEAEHAEILRTRSLDLRPELDESEAQQRLRDGVLVHDAAAMEFLVAIANDRTRYINSDRNVLSVTGKLCKHSELEEHLRGASQQRYAVLVIELVNAAHQLRYHLERIEPRSRGRA